MQNTAGILQKLQVYPCIFDGDVRVTRLIFNGYADDCLTNFELQLSTKGELHLSWLT
jgi:hypothetical protein